jgi:hypothetical protein
MRRINLAFGAAILMGIVAPVSAADDQSKSVCIDAWRPIDAYVVAGEGMASIQHQCLPHEKPCPPKAELIRRAETVARAYALAQIRQKVKTEVSAEVVIEDGRSVDRIIMKAEGAVYELTFCQKYNPRKVTVRVVGEIKEPI